MSGKCFAVCVALGFGSALMVQAWAEPKYTPRASPRAKKPPRPADEVGTAYVIFDEVEGEYKTSGWMPGGDIHLTQTMKHKDDPKSGKFSYKAECDLTDDTWMGVAWLLDGEWEPKRKRNILTRIGARLGDPVVLRFWVRSNSGATVQFKVGGAPGDSLRSPVGTGWVKIPRHWQQVEIDLTKKDLSACACPLLWVVNQDRSGSGKLSFQIDCVYFTMLSKRPKPKKIGE